MRAAAHATNTSRMSTAIMARNAVLEVSDSSDPMEPLVPPLFVSTVAFCDGQGGLTQSGAGLPSTILPGPFITKLPDGLGEIVAGEGADADTDADPEGEFDGDDPIVVPDVGDAIRVPVADSAPLAATVTEAAPLLVAAEVTDACNEVVGSTDVDTVLTVLEPPEPVMLGDGNNDVDAVTLGEDDGLSDGDCELVPETVPVIVLVTETVCVTLPLYEGEGERDAGEGVTLELHDTVPVMDKDSTCVEVGVAARLGEMLQEGDIEGEDEGDMLIEGDGDMLSEVDLDMLLVGSMDAETDEDTVLLIDMELERLGVTVTETVIETEMLTVLDTVTLADCDGDGVLDTDHEFDTLGDMDIEGEVEGDDVGLIDTEVD
jgi:hypothetical protein